MNSENYHLLIVIMKPPGVKEKQLERERERKKLGSNFPRNLLALTLMFLSSNFFGLNIHKLTFYELSFKG